MLVKLLLLWQVKLYPFGILKIVGDNWTKANSDKIAPIIAVPTTAGTGSETGRASVILNQETGVKNIIFSSKIFTINSYFRSSFNSWVTIKNDCSNWNGCIST